MLETVFRGPKILEGTIELIFSKKQNFSSDAKIRILFSTVAYILVWFILISRLKCLKDIIPENRVKIGYALISLFFIEAVWVLLYFEEDATR